MSDKSNEYGYVGASPTQASGSNTGVFEVNDVTDLLNNNKWTLQTLDVSYLVIAGAGGGGANAGGGGGAGGYRNSYASETSGRNSSTETPLAVTLGSNVTVTVGAGGAGGVWLGTNIGTQGSNSVFSTISSTGGGFGGSANVSGTGGTGGSGGGDGHNAGSGGSGTANQGFDGGDIG